MTENFKGRPDSERQQPEQQGRNWSDIPRDIVECVIGHLHWTDRIRIRAVCKAWSIPTHHIPTISKVPWATVTVCCLTLFLESMLSKTRRHGKSTGFSFQDLVLQSMGGFFSASP
ncbi:hypothetical protein V6N13_118325 [Hibiscus sabdariffa]|uniref:F-box domain-containing protein n=1 Tax=Hibiscus sabdariffa TaxID=183260 RepID=A0ABR2Q863_9ROSI